MADQLTVSVIVPAYRAEATLPRCVAALLAQDTSEPFEVIVVASADHPDQLPSMQVPTDDRVNLITAVPRLSAAAARNRGAAEAQGSHLCFTDANAVPRPSWLRSLLDVGRDGTDIVAGAVVNANPESAAATVEYIVEFIDLHPRRPARTAWHGAACNLLFPRAVWLEYGPWPELRGGEDTLLTSRARSAGHYQFAAEAVVERLGRTGMRAVLEHQRGIGRYVAHVGRRGPHKLRPLVRYSPLAPLATLGRIVSVYGRVLAWGGEDRVRFFRLAPNVLAAIGCWGAGLFAEGMRLDRAEVASIWRRR